MNFWLRFTISAVVLTCIGIAIKYLLAKQHPRVRPPPRVQPTERTYQVTNHVARLFLEVLELKKVEVQWPAILQQLNPEDEPHIRTLLLELRASNATDPRQALDAIEEVCIAAKPESERLSRAELLERARARLSGTNST
jgi:hypothetical protein